MGLERPRARYRQVADELREAVRRGEFGPGDSLPSQPELARRYGLNQTSINRAIALLESEGLIRTEHGRGSFVVDTPTVKRVRRIPPADEGQSSSFADQMHQAGLTARTELVQAEAADAPFAVSQRLGIAAGERVLVRRRHMFADEWPVQLAVSYIPLDVAGGVELAFPDTGPTGIHRRLAERGYVVVRISEDIEARRPVADEQEFLRVGSGQYVLEVQRLAFSGEGRALELVRNVFPADVWRLTYEWAVENGN